MEERGLSITWSALRVSYAQGGDGESEVRADLRHFAAFVRDPCAIVTCILLPFSCSLHLEMQVRSAFSGNRPLFAIPMQAPRRPCRQSSFGLISLSLHWITQACARKAMCGTRSVCCKKLIMERGRWGDMATGTASA